MDNNVTLDLRDSTDKVSMINAYLDAVNNEAHVENPTVTSVNTSGIISELLIGAPINIDLKDFKVTNDSPEVTSVNSDNGPKIDLKDDDHDGIPNYLDAKDGNLEISKDSNNNGVEDKIDATGTSNTDTPHDTKEASKERVRSSLISAIMTLLQFDFSLALGGADPSENEANKIGALAQTSLGITFNRDAKVQDIDNSRNVGKEMKQHKIRTNKLKLKRLEKAALTKTTPITIAEKTKFKKLSKHIPINPKNPIIKTSETDKQLHSKNINQVSNKPINSLDQPINRPSMI